MGFGFTCTVATLAVLLAAPPAVGQAPNSAAIEAGATALVVAQAARSLAAQGKLEEAIEQGQKALALARTQFGPQHAYVAYMLDDLATWRFRQQRFDEALTLSRQAVELVSQSLGADAVESASLLNNRGSILSGMGRPQEAAPVFEQSRTAYVKHLGADHERSAQLSRNLGTTYLELSQLEDARKNFFEAVRAGRLSQAKSLDLARAHNGLANVHLRLDAFGEARLEAENAQRIVAAQGLAAPNDMAEIAVTLSQVDIHESKLEAAKGRLENALKQLDSGNAQQEMARASVLFNIGWVHILRRQTVEAERAYKDVLGIYRRRLGSQHPNVGKALHSLAIVYQDLGQFGQAEQFYRQAIDIFTASFGAADASVAASRLEYSSLLTELDRPAEGMREAQAALEIFNRLPSGWRLKRGYANSVLALALHHSGDLMNAQTAYLRALELIGAVAGGQSSDLAPGLTDLARILRKLGRFDEAETRLLLAIAILERDGANTAGGLAESLSELVELRIAQGRVAEGMATSRKAIGIATRRIRTAQQVLTAAAPGEQSQARGLYEQFLETAWMAKSVQVETSLGEMFEAAQEPHMTGTADAVSRTAARFAAGAGKLASLVRERQDAVENLIALDRYRVERLTRLQGGASPVGEENIARLKQEQLFETVERLDARLRTEFPRYAELTSPQPIAAAAVQSQLRSEEALFLQITSAKATYLFLVTRDAVKFARTELTRQQLQLAVASIRKGLDLQNVSRLSELLQFDSGSARLLHQRLFEPFLQELKNVKHLIVVVDGAMQNLPVSLLLASPVVAPPKSLSDFGNWDYFGRRHAISVVPSVSSFMLLRTVSDRSRGGQPFVGFGDPALEGKGGVARSALVKELAVDTDPAVLRQSLLPLPETRGELQAIARALNSSDAALHFQERASETFVKRADLSKYRILAFATHGLLAGDFRGLAEPALVLTPPQKATPLDDGLLTASEIAMLKLDADWVLLSACNTAGPIGRPGAEGLSGLARAFFYAGSRAMLVSHWWVASDATTVLMIKIIESLAKDPSIGRAEALRQGILQLMDGKPKASFAHPVFWAPFVNVGEGGAGL